MKNTTGIYVASRVSRAPMWRGLRDNGGVPITSTWIDEDGEGQTADFGELWTRCAREIAASTGLVFYADVNDAPWKGALVEVGIALALWKPVGVVQLGEFEGRTMRPVGSWIHHPAVKVTRYIGEAIDHAQGETRLPEGRGFVKVMQPGPDDCMRACLATYFGCPIEDVPMLQGKEWNAEVRAFAHQRGFGYVTIAVPNEQVFLDGFSGGMLIVSGMSARERLHAVIYKDGKLWHDPHPDSDGIKAIEQVDFFYPLAPFAVFPTRP